MLIFQKKIYINLMAYHLSIDYLLLSAFPYLSLFLLQSTNKWSTCLFMSHFTENLLLWAIIKVRMKYDKPMDSVMITNEDQNIAQ
jgi:hypothetical protein